MQRQRIFWETAPSDEEKLARIEGPGSPFAKFVGNELALQKLKVAAFQSLSVANHMMRDLAFAIFGPSSAGKTTVGRLYAETVELPFVEVSPKAIKTVDDLFKEIGHVLHAEGLPLVPMGAKNHFVLPPVVIFIDEVHALADSVVQGLLKATEFGDAKMAAESGKTINTYNVTWMIATTDEGKLFDAFRTRFSPVVLKYLNKADVAKIVKLASPDLSDDVCSLVAHYNSRIPRKALAFARYMRLLKGMRGGSWEEVARQAAHGEGVDEHGMHEVHLKILRALGKGPIARNRISLVSGSKDEETERYILPWLLTETEDQAALVTVSGKGYTITEAGLRELDKRGIDHLGAKAIAA